MQTEACHCISTREKGTIDDQNVTKSDHHGKLRSSGAFLDGAIIGSELGVNLKTSETKVSLAGNIV